MYIDKRSELWKHTLMRINNAEQTSKNYEQFARQMVTRLQRITHAEKVHYAIAALQQKGYQDLVDVYEGRFVMDKLIKAGNPNYKGGLK